MNCRGGRGRWNFLSREENNLCIYLEEITEGIGKILFIKDVTNPVLEIRFVTFFFFFFYMAGYLLKTKELISLTHNT